MSKKEVEGEIPRDAQLTILEARRNALYEYLQRLYDSSKNIESNVNTQITFICETENIESIRTDFLSVLDSYNSRLLTISPDATPNYSPLLSFEQLYSRVLRLRSQHLPRDSNKQKPAEVARKVVPTLPPIELVAFNGTISAWPLFYASFKSTIHDNPSLSDAEKLYYLLGKLSDKASSAISGITPSPENYNLILKTLIDKYEDKRTLASVHMRQILDFKPLQGNNNLDTFIDKFVTSVNALKNLKLDNLTDFMLLYIALQKLDSSSVQAFEMSVDSNKIPSFDSLVEFIKSQHKILMRNSPNNSSTNEKKGIRSSNNKNYNSASPKYQTYVNTAASTCTYKCLCNNITHPHLFKCPTFSKLTPEERFKITKENNACVNCLSIRHRASSCNSKIHCRVCQSKHHTLLHFSRTCDSNPQPAPSREQSLMPNTPASSATGGCSEALAAPARPIIDNPRTKERTDVSLVATSIDTRRVSPSSLPCVRSEQCIQTATTTTVLLATAQVYTYDSQGNKHVIRILLDSASQSNFITNECCERLGLQKIDKQRIVVRGFGGSEKTVKGSVNLEFSSRFGQSVKYTASSLMVDKITDNLPTALVDISKLPHLKNIPLADCSFATPNKIDALIGASLFPHLLLPNVIEGGSLAPPAIETVLGYVIMGSVPTVQARAASLTCCHITVEEPIDNLLKRFFDLEEVPSASPIQCHDDTECELFFKSTTDRDPASGRYIVGLPFKEDMFLLGDTYGSARKYFLCLEKKLQASPKLKAAYDGVITEYIDNGYLSPVLPENDQSDDLSQLMYVIPHHGVVKEDKVTTKLRVVLNASFNSSSGHSLNDLLHSGPNLQGDLFTIVLLFRLYAVAMTGDCRQMFLQIIMRQSDRRFQRILYRFNPQDPLMLYEFNRVCFGLKSSPYHALRTVRQLVQDDGHLYPLASQIVADCLYMDDVAFSVKSEPEANRASEELIQLFKGAGWDLLKWNSNSPSALDNIPETHKLATDIEFEKAVQHKILGLHWSTDSDYFYFKTIPVDDKCTKRTMLSTIARLWDIMGFVAPIITYAKLLIKQLWQLNIDWDSVPPPHIVKMWRQFCSELPTLNEFKIPRHLGVADGCTITLLGFSDASSVAYGGVVYLHVSSPSGITVRLVCAKSRVAPMKPLSIARLELCGALLLSKLMRVVLDAYRSRFPINVFAFTDSKVALYWIKSSPHRWQTFVANRVVKVTENISAENFHHVSGEENPADCLSRGLTPQQLLSNPLWTHGPSWTSQEPSQWPIENVDIPQDNLPEQKTHVHATVLPNSIQQSPLCELTQRFSSWSKLLRVLVYTFRMLKLLPRRDNHITPQDLDFAENKLLTTIQSKYFSREIINLKNNKPCSPAINKLRPFLHTDGLVRVGGRLTNSELDFESKHPVLLPRNDHVTNLLIDYHHVKYLHAGPELLLSLLRQKYWVISARRVVRQRVHLCNTCFRMKPQPSYPIMSDLPDIRTRQVIKAFTNTGVDYAGPIPYVPIRRRGTHSQKAYLCIFTCLTTRATHIEVATDMTTVSFLAALKRFLSRRGPVTLMKSDNGTNFVGANAYLKDLYKFLDKEYRPKFEEYLAENRISWQFNCPTASHFGGCWESIVKVVKNHLFKVIGKQLLSYEELNTVIIQIECLLNSRPLTVLSSDPAEPTALTPSHFLNTAPLSSLPAAQVESENVNLLHRHALLDKIVQSFWKRWSSEYLQTLQVREKWNTPSTPISPGTLVVIMTDNLPPLSWPLGVIDKVHPSKDGVIRVASVKTSKGVYLRPVVKLCPLPSQ